MSNVVERGEKEGQMLETFKNEFRMTKQNFIQ